MRNRLRQHAPAIGAACAVAAMCVYAFVVRIRFLHTDPYPWGVDSYYYPVQLRSLLDSGHLNYPALPMVFWLLAPLAWLTDPIEGTKLGAALGTGLMSIPVYLLGKRLCGERAPALVGAALAATSLQAFYLSTEFVKEGVGLTIGAAAVAAILAAVAQPSRRRIGLAVALLLGALLAHKTAFGLALALAAPAVAHDLWKRGYRWRLAGGAALLFALSLAVFGVADLRLFQSAFTDRADWSMPALVTSRVALYFGRDVTVAAVLGVGVAAVCAFRRQLPPALIGFVALALLLGIPWLDVHNVQGLGFRLRLMAYVLSGPLAAWLIVNLVPTTTANRAWMSLAVAATLLVMRPSELPKNEGQVRTHPALVAAVRALDGVLPPGSTLITQDRKIAFMTRWYANQPVRLHPPADLDPWTTYRLIPRNLQKQDLKDTLSRLRAERPAGVIQPRDLHPVDPNGLVLMPEATFQWVLDHLQPATREHYLAWPTT